MHAECTPKYSELDDAGTPDDPTDDVCRCKGGFDAELEELDANEFVIKCKADRITRQLWRQEGLTGELREELFGDPEDDDSVGAIGELQAEQKALADEIDRIDSDVEDLEYGQGQLKKRVTANEEYDRRLGPWTDRVDNRLEAGEDADANGSDYDESQDEDIEDVQEDVEALEEEVDGMARPIFGFTLGGGACIHIAPGGDDGSGEPIQLSMPLAPCAVLGGFIGVVEKTKTGRSGFHGGLIDFAVEFAPSTSYDEVLGEMSDQIGTSVGIRISGGYFGRADRNNVHLFIGGHGRYRRLDMRLTGLGLANQISFGPTFGAVIPIAKGFGVRLRADIGLLGFMAVDPVDPEAKSVLYAPDFALTAELILGRF